MFYRAVARLQCGPIPGDPWKRKIVVDTARGPLVDERRRAELLAKLLESQKRGEGVVQEIKYDDVSP